MEMVGVTEFTKMGSIPSLKTEIEIISSSDKRPKTKLRREGGGVFADNPNLEQTKKPHWKNVLFYVGFNTVNDMKYPTNENLI